MVKDTNRDIIEQLAGDNSLDIFHDGQGSQGPSPPEEA